MNKDQNEFIKIISFAVFGKSGGVECDFEKQESLSVSHYCNSLLCQGLINCGINPPKTWKDAAMIVVLNNYKNLTVQSEVVGILNKNNIPCAVIKGITAAVNYSKPMSRALGDIDILVEENDYEKAVSLFGVEIEKRDNKFHTAFNHNGVSVEIHKGIDDYKTGMFGDKLSSAMKDALNNISLVEFDGFKIPCLENKYQAVMYLNHMHRHFLDNELSMRMFCDWAAFVSKISYDEWNDNVYPLLEEIGFDLFADALNKAVIKYMNIELNIKSKHETNEKMADYLMEEFVFDGTKKGEEFLDGNIATSYAKNNSGFIVGSIELLNSIAKRELKISRYKILLPLCWLYILLRYLFNSVSGKRKFVSYKKINETVSRRNKIKEELKLF